MRATDRANVPTAGVDLPFRQTRRVFFARLFLIGSAAMFFSSVLGHFIRRPRRPRAERGPIKARLHPLAVPRTPTTLSRTS